MSFKLKNLIGSFDTIEEALKSGRTIKKLDLFTPENDLNYFKTDLDKFQNLVELNFHGNHLNLQEILTGLSSLTNLKKLHILNLEFKEFPSWILKLHNLENLKFRGNDIQILPEAISQLQNLKHLRVENTDLEQLPTSLSTLKNLQTLSLVDNYNLLNIDEKCLPQTLKWLALSPSGIPEERQLEIVSKFPKLELNKRYFK